MYEIPELDPSDTFTFSHRGNEYAFPKMADVTFEQISLLDNLDDTAGLRVLFGSLNPTFAEDVLPKLSTSQIGDLIRAWQADSGVTVGESSASATSS